MSSTTFPLDKALIQFKNVSSFMEAVATADNPDKVLQDERVQNAYILAANKLYTDLMQSNSMALKSLVQTHIAKKLPPDNTCEPPEQKTTKLARACFEFFFPLITSIPKNEWQGARRADDRISSYTDLTRILKIMDKENYGACIKALETRCENRDIDLALNLIMTSKDFDIFLLEAVRQGAVNVLKTVFRTHDLRWHYYTVIRGALIKGSPSNMQQIEIDELLAIIDTKNPLTNFRGVTHFFDALWTVSNILKFIKKDEVKGVVKQVSEELYKELQTSGNLLKELCTKLDIEITGNDEQDAKSFFSHLFPLMACIPYHMYQRGTSQIVSSVKEDHPRIDSYQNAIAHFSNAIMSFGHAFARLQSEFSEKERSSAITIIADRIPPSHAAKACQLATRESLPEILKNLKERKEREEFEKESENIPLFVFSEPGQVCQSISEALADFDFESAEKKLAVDKKMREKMAAYQRSNRSEKRAMLPELIDFAVANDRPQILGVITSHDIPNSDLALQIDKVCTKNTTFIFRVLLNKYDSSDVNGLKAIINKALLKAINNKLYDIIDFLFLWKSNYISREIATQKINEIENGQIGSYEKYIHKKLKSLFPQNEQKKSPPIKKRKLSSTSISAPKQSEEILPAHKSKKKKPSRPRRSKTDYS
jgi:hypothetical protein